MNLLFSVCQYYRETEVRNVTKGAPGPVRWQDWNPVCRRKALALTTCLYFLLSPPDSAFPPHLSSPTPISCDLWIGQPGLFGMKYHVSLGAIIP